MRIRVWEGVCVLFLGVAVANALRVFHTSAVLAHAQATSPGPWVGVWQGELDGQPSVVLTLARDNAALEGTLVLNIISRDGGQPHVIAHEPHVLMRPQIEGDTLAFQVERIDGSSAAMDFTVRRTSNNSAAIHCLNCGADAPIVAMTKLE